MKRRAAASSGARAIQRAVRTPAPQCEARVWVVVLSTVRRIQLSVIDVGRPPRFRRLAVRRRGGRFRGRLRAARAACAGTRPRSRTGRRTPSATRSRLTTAGAPARRAWRPIPSPGRARPFSSRTATNELPMSSLRAGSSWPGSLNLVVFRSGRDPGAGALGALAARPSAGHRPARLCAQDRSSARTGAAGRRTTGWASPRLTCFRGVEPRCDAARPPLQV